MDTLLKAAQRYAGLGYKVFPCTPDEKRPLGSLASNGCKDATDDLEQIETWWGECPNANIGLSTEGLLVVDVDGKDNPWLADSPDRQLSLGAAPMSLTPRGGSHRLFAQPDDKCYRCTTNKLADKVDTRADGGYIVAPPSIVAGKEYTWQQGWLDDMPHELPDPPSWLIVKLDSCERPTKSPAAATRGPEVGTDGIETRAIAYLAQMPPAIQGQCGSKAAYAAATALVHGFGLRPARALDLFTQCYNPRCEPEWSSAEIEHKIDDATTKDHREPYLWLRNQGHDFGDGGIDVSGLLASGGITDETEADDDEYEEEDEPDDRQQDPGLFPEHLLNVPGFIGEYIEFANRTAPRRQPVLALGAVLALLGTLTGRKITDLYGTRTNLYCLGVCGSSGGKDRARQINREILEDAGLKDLAGPEGIASHAGLTNAIAHHRVLLFQLDEIGRFLQTINSPKAAPHLFSIVTVLMKLYTSSSARYIGDAYADLKNIVTINQPHACVYGTTVPESLYSGLTSESMTDGFIGRLLVFESDDHRPPLQLVPKESPPESLVKQAAYWGAFSPGGNLACEIPQPMVVLTTEEATRIWVELEDRADREHDSGSKTSASWGRVGEKARKLALLYACSVNATEPVVDREAAQWAADLASYLTERLLYRAEGWIAENAYEASRQRVVRILQAAPNGTMTLTQLARKTQSMRPHERKEVIAALVETDDVRIGERQGKGRPALVISLVR